MPEVMVTIRPAASAEVVDLRSAILRPGFPREAAIYDVDARPQTRHFVATIDEHVVGCVTIFPSPWPGHGDAWQLRGMAVADDVQGAGVGRKLLAAVDDFLRTPTPLPPLIWCNARVTASAFYERCGWVVASKVFDLPPIGPHVKMTRQL